MPAPTPLSGSSDTYASALDAAAKTVILRAFAATHGSRTEAAARLGLPLRTLYHHVHRLGLRPEIERAHPSPPGAFAWVSE